MVRPFLLYSEAAKRDPSTLTYQLNRDTLAPVAKLLLRTELEPASIAADIVDAESIGEEPLTVSGQVRESATIPAKEIAATKAAEPKIEPPIVRAPGGSGACN